MSESAFGPSSSEAQAPSAMDLFGGGSRATTTRDRLVEAALELFYTHGFHAVGLQQILDAVGISKQAFYRHFESKDDLAVEAARLRDRLERAAFETQVRKRGGNDPAAMLLAMFDVLDTWFNHPDYTGCIFLNDCAEFPDPHDPIHCVAAENYRLAEEQIRGLAAAAGASDPVRLAHDLVCLLMGAVTRRLVFGDNTAARMARGLAGLVVAGQTTARSADASTPASAG